MIKMVLLVNLIVISAISAAEADGVSMQAQSDRDALVKQLKHDLKVAFQEEVEINYGKPLDPSRSGWSLNPVASLQLIMRAEELRKQNYAKLRSLKLAKIYEILTTDPSQCVVSELQDQLKKVMHNVTHRVGMFYDRNFPTVMFFHVHAYPKSFAALDALMAVARVKK